MTIWFGMEIRAIKAVQDHHGRHHLHADQTAINIPECSRMLGQVDRLGSVITKGLNNKLGSIIHDRNKIFQ